MAINCRSLPQLGSVERPWKFRVQFWQPHFQSVYDPHNSVREVSISTLLLWRKQAKVAKDIVKFKNESLWKPTHQSSLRCYKQMPPEIPWEDRLHVWGVTTVVSPFLVADTSMKSLSAWAHACAFLAELAVRNLDISKYWLLCGLSTNRFQISSHGSDSSLCIWNKCFWPRHL